jgi:hypothetical protein
MHKDKPPGVFDFAERGVRYLVGFWFTTGLVLSILVRTALLVWGDASESNRPRQSSDMLETETNARKPASANPPPPPTDAVRY